MTVIKAMKRMPGLWWPVVILLVLLVINAAPVAAENQVFVLKIEGTITAGQLNFIKRQIQAAEEVGADLLVIVLNTPGGIVDATLEINEAFLNARVPVAVFVAPAGAIAGSAGAFIVVSSDIAAMAPGTTIGAAHPVALTPEGTTAADEKTTKFLAGHIKSLAREKGRPTDVAEKFVTENLSISSREALEKGLIEYLVHDLDELLDVLDGVEIEKKGRTYTLNTAGATVVHVEMNAQERFQNWLSDPQIAFILLMLGILGIYFGLNMPGTIVPEVGGVIMLIMGIYGIGLFDTGTTGIILLILGIGLIIAEIFTAGFGVLGIGGAVCLVSGAILLPQEPLMAAEWYGTFRSTAFGAVIGVSIIVLLIIYSVVRSRKKWTEGSAFFLPPKKATVTVELNPVGMVTARGELWKARSEGGKTIPVGTEVEVVRAENLTLWVRPLQEKSD